MQKENTYEDLSMSQHLIATCNSPEAVIREGVVLGFVYKADRSLFGYRYKHPVVIAAETIALFDRQTSSEEGIQDLLDCFLDVHSPFPLNDLYHPIDSVLESDKFFFVIHFNHLLDYDADWYNGQDDANIVRDYLTDWFKSGVNQPHITDRMPRLLYCGISDKEDDQFDFGIRECFDC